MLSKQTAAAAGACVTPKTNEFRQARIIRTNENARRLVRVPPTTRVRAHRSPFCFLYVEVARNPGLEVKHDSWTSRKVLH